MGELRAQHTSCLFQITREKALIYSEIVLYLLRPKYRAKKGPPKPLLRLRFTGHSQSSVNFPEQLGTRNILLAESVVRSLQRLTA